MADHEENGFDDFAERFSALMDEGLKYGIRSVVALNDNDPLSSDETKTVLYRGGYANAIGLAVYSQHMLLTEKPN